MEIAPGVHQFGTAAVNLFLIETSNGLILVDTGLPRDTKKLMEQMRGLDLDPAAVRTIFLTHGDMDHIGGAARFKAASGAPVLAHHADVALIEGRELREMPQRGVGRLVGPVFNVITNTFMKPTPVQVDRIVSDGDTLADGWRVLHLPGHTRGHVGLYHADKKVLIAGDALRNQGGVNLPPGIVTPDMTAARASVRKLAQLDFDVLGVGHGAPITRGAGEQVRRLAAKMKE